jgi:hypothetical protein
VFLVFLRGAVCARLRAIGLALAIRPLRPIGWLVTYAVEGGSPELSHGVEEMSDGVDHGGMAPRQRRCGAVLPGAWINLLGEHARGEGTVCDPDDVFEAVNDIPNDI